MTNDGVNTIVYDGENRATGSSNGSASGVYTYDGNGQRVKKVSGSTTTVTIFLGTQVLAEYVNGVVPSSPTGEYIYAGGQRVASIQSGTTNYWHNDHLSPRVRTTTTGAIADQRGTYPYGETWYSPAGSPYMFTTYYRDSESGNDYAQARYDITRFGRFSSPDSVAGSITDPQSLNRYSYVRNMPLMLADPSGLVPCAIVENRNDSSSSESASTGGPSASGFLADPGTPQRCGPPCYFTLFGCGGTGGGDDDGGGGGVGGLFPSGDGGGSGGIGPLGFIGGGSGGGGGGWGPIFIEAMLGPNPDCFPFFSDGAGFTVFVGNCGGGQSGGGARSATKANDPCADIKGKGGVKLARDSQTGEITSYGFDPNGQLTGYGRLISGTDVSGNGYFIPGGIRGAIELTSENSVRIDFSQPIRLGGRVGAFVTSASFAGETFTQVKGAVAFGGLQFGSAKTGSDQLRDSLNANPSAVGLGITTWRLMKLLNSWVNCNMIFGGS